MSPEPVDKPGQRDKTGHVPACPRIVRDGTHGTQPFRGVPSVPVCHPALRHAGVLSLPIRLSPKAGAGRGATKELGGRVALPLAPSVPPASVVVPSTQCPGGRRRPTTHLRAEEGGGDTLGSVWVAGLGLASGQRLQPALHLTCFAAGAGKHCFRKVRCMTASLAPNGFPAGEQPGGLGRTAGEADLALGASHGR